LRGLLHVAHPGDRRFTSAERAEIELLVADAAEAAIAWVSDVEKATQLAGQRRSV